MISMSREETDESYHRGLGQNEQQRGKSLTRYESDLFLSLCVETNLRATQQRFVTSQSIKWNFYFPYTPSTSQSKTDSHRLHDHACIYHSSKENGEGGRANMRESVNV